MIYLSPYNPEWPSLFELEKNTLFNAISDCIVEIVHIGSTSIVGIHAKPIIDIMVGVDSLAKVDHEVIQVFEKQGYQYMKKYEQLMPYRRYFYKNNPDDIRTHQIHLVEIHSDFWNRHLLFRDYLRAHPNEAKQYEALKQVLAKEFTDVNQYADAKTAFCEAIHIKAMEWQHKEKPA